MDELKDRVTSVLDSSRYVEERSLFYKTSSVRKRYNIGVSFKIKKGIKMIDSMKLFIRLHNAWKPVGERDVLSFASVNFYKMHDTEGWIPLLFNYSMMHNLNSDIRRLKRHKDRDTVNDLSYILEAFGQEYPDDENVYDCIKKI